MRIGSCEIGPGGRGPYIIAELGVNHDGSAERLMELTRAAAGAGADAIKLQLFKADLLMSRAAKLAAYQRAAGERDPIEMLRRLELSIEQMRPAVDLAHSLGVHTIVTVFSMELVAEAEGMGAPGCGGWDAYKTASPDIVNKPLLDALAASGRPLIVSTGAAEIDEIARARRWLDASAAAGRLAFLQCVSSYPTPREQAELGGIAAIGAVVQTPVGYSDHTPAVETGEQAVACGAVILEKHFTYSKHAAGPDHAASLEPAEFREYAQRARQAAGDKGRGRIASHAVEVVKRVLPIERDVRAVSRQSLTTTRALPVGHRLARADLTVKRPGTGVPPFEMDAVLGRVLERAVEADTPLMPDDLGSMRP